MIEFTYTVLICIAGTFLLGIAPILLSILKNKKIKIKHKNTEIYIDEF